MTRKRRPHSDLIEQEIELVLNPGAFIPDRACFTFVSDLDAVAAKIDKLVSSDPAHAVALYETFLAACYVKVEELDDSSGKHCMLAGERHLVVPASSEAAFKRTLRDVGYLVAMGGVKVAKPRRKASGKKSASHSVGD
jgi:hypothetical protein